MEANDDQGASGKAAWQTTSIKIERIRRRIYTTSGFLDDAAADQTAGVVSSTFVQDGRILAPRANGCRPGESPPSRAILREDDLAVVLVRRVGDSALVTAEHAGCTATRSIGIIRAEPHIVRWLRIWLQTPTAKARIDEDVTAHVEPTISLDTLHRMLFPLPPPGVVTAYHRAFTLIEEMVSLYQHTARKAMELADALHDDVATSEPLWDTRTLAKVARLKTGSGSESSLPLMPAEAAVDLIAPRDLYDLPVPHVHRFRLSGPARDGAVHPPGTFMLSTRSDSAHIAVSSRASTPLRSVVAVRPLDDEDSWWLLHELRSRSNAIVDLAQGQTRREISALRLRSLALTWPGRFTRADFRRSAEPLHATARLLVSKIATLHTLREALLRDISAKAGVLREPTTEPEGQHLALSAPRGEGNLDESGWGLEA
ncbi:hypothetical protein A4U61_30450 [Streptomyces sp. H-KF8]|uniref:hypothetical protein n=1 Tax=Streptomyces sp. H-KF8 TaxID=1727216 RepID=UPI0007ED8E47|nr:hypothetical protein [Streptomyces sp. H-KF8]OBQ49261.1 hypothetical protein A4U61_30450 [Streptomyces sp. H-KF8]